MRIVFVSTLAALAVTLGGCSHRVDNTPVQLVQVAYIAPFLGVLAVTCGLPCHGEPASPYVGYAQRLLRDKKYDEAEKYLRVAVRDPRAKPEVQALFVIALAQNGKLKESCRESTKIKDNTETKIRDDARALGANACTPT